MSILQRAVVSGVALGLVACGGRTVEPVSRGSGGAGATGGFSAAGGSAAGGGSTPQAPPTAPYPVPSIAAASCAEPGTVVDVCDLPSIQLWLARSWFFCSGASIYDSPHDGLELTQDGHWFFLDLKDGALVRRQGFAGGGEWKLTDSSAMNGPGPFAVQLDFASYQGGGVPAFVRFAVDPLKLALSAYPGEPAEYLAVNPESGPIACAVCHHGWFTCGKEGMESVDFQMEAQTPGGCQGSIVQFSGPTTKLDIHCSPPEVCSASSCVTAQLTDTSFAWEGATCWASTD